MPSKRSCLYLDKICIFLKQIFLLNLIQQLIYSEAVRFIRYTTITFSEEVKLFTSFVRSSRDGFLIGPGSRKVDKLNKLSQISTRC